MDSVVTALENAWASIIDIATKLVTPDWGALVALIPIGLALLVVLFLAWIAVRYANAGPTRRGPRRVTPRAPGGAHMPGPSFAPVFAAIGAFLTFLGLVLGGVALWLGIAALALTLLYWLREAMRDYEAMDRPVSSVPAVVETDLRPSPPAGVHMPGPSFRPLLVSLAAAVLFLGLVMGPGLVLAGAVMLVVALLGWLGDAGREYEATAEADVTGHAGSGPAPRYPIGTLATFVVVLVLGIAVTAGVIPPTSGEGGTAGSPAPGASAAPGGSAAPGTSGSAAPGASAAPGGSAGAPTADVTVKAQNIAFDVTDVSAPAGKPFTIAFVNEDAGIPHNIAIKDGSGAEVFKGDIITGVATKVYQVPALAAGSYPFACSVHPNMTGTLTVK